MSTVGFNCPSTIGQKNESFVMSTANIKLKSTLKSTFIKLMSHIDIKNIQPNFFSTKIIFPPNYCVSCYFLKTFLTSYWPYGICNLTSVGCKNQVYWYAMMSIWDSSAHWYGNLLKCYSLTFNSLTEPSSALILELKYWSPVWYFMCCNFCGLWSQVTCYSKQFKSSMWKLSKDEG